MQMAPKSMLSGSAYHLRYAGFSFQVRSIYELQQFIQFSKNVHAIQKTATVFWQ